MTDIFISYARPSALQARAVAEALRALGYDVWLDDALPAHRDYASVIEERLTAARAVVVLWSADAVRSQWVRSEADRARNHGKLVQLTLDGAALPMPFDQIQCADLVDWTGDGAAPGWRKVVDSIADLTGRPQPSPPLDRRDPRPTTRRVSVCVLPFINMSGEAEQEYFSDGISEDIITDLSKVSALSVVSRSSAFRFKGQAVDPQRLARELSVSHVLEGSVRKAGARVRIAAQLIDATSRDHVWAERYDRDLTDIFAVQDEISEAIVGALKLELLPEEKRAIERRGTDNADAYNLCLMARRQLVSGNQGDIRRDETMLRLARRAVEIDPDYAEAWALIARAESNLGFNFHAAGDRGLAAAERALALNPNLAEAHAVKARRLAADGASDAALAEIETVIRLDPGSREANTMAGDLCFRRRRFAEAIGHYERAAGLDETDFTHPGVLIGCYQACGEATGALRAARQTLRRAERALAADASNGAALGFGAIALAALGESAKARTWIESGLRVDPDNPWMRSRLACALVALDDGEAAIDLLAPIIPTLSRSALEYLAADPGLDPVRSEPRLAAAVRAAEAR